MKKTTDRNTTKIVLIIIFLAVLIVGYYAYLSNKGKEAQADASLSEVQNVLVRDLALDYPATPKEVIKFYNRILDCFYNEEATEEEISELGNKARELYDEDLLANNELGVYFVSLKAEIKEYKDKNRKITGFSLASSTNVEYFEEDGFSFARIMCGYNIMEAGVSTPTKQVYLLRKDASGKWKIFGWQPAEQLEQTAESQAATAKE